MGKDFIVLGINGFTFHLKIQILTAQIHKIIKLKRILSHFGTRGIFFFFFAEQILPGSSKKKFRFFADSTATAGKKTKPKQKTHQDLAVLERKESLKRWDSNTQGFGSWFFAGFHGKILGMGLGKRCQTLSKEHKHPQGPQKWKIFPGKALGEKEPNPQEGICGVGFGIGFGKSQVMECFGWEGSFNPILFQPSGL